MADPKADCLRYRGLYIIGHSALVIDDTNILLLLFHLKFSATFTCRLLLLVLHPVK
jgi:hypothetical protein